jgi:hypothetical protein
MSQATQPATAEPARPKLTVPRVLLGSLVGCLLGLAPGPAVAPALYVCLVGVLLLLRAPVLVVLGLAVVTKLLSFALLGAQVELGRLLLDGPTQGLFQTMINAPFLALFGLEYYAVTGGYALALAFAALATFLITRSRKATTTGRPAGLLRPVGLALFVVSLGAFWLLQSPAAEGILTDQAAKGLGKLNGATVDVAGVDLDLAAGRLEVSDLAFANPRALDTDLFHGLQLAADIGNADLMRKRLHVERLVISKAESGKPRGVPGVLIGAPAEPEVVEPEEGERGIDDYLKDWEVWRDRLAQAREWIEKMGGDESEAPVEDLPPEQLIASHLIEGAPSLLVSELAIEGLDLAWLPDRVFDIAAHNISTQPSLVDGALDLVVSSRDEQFRTAFTLPSGDSPGTFQLSVRELSVDSIASMLKLGEGSVLRGGTVELSLDGPWSNGVAGFIDMPLDITLRDIELGLSGSKSFPISELKLPIHVRGPLDGLNLRLDTGALSKALIDAGAKELANFVEVEKQRLMEEGQQLLQDEFDEQLGGKLEELLGTDIDVDVTDPAAALAELEAQAQLKLQAELEAAKLEAKAALAAQVQAALDGAPQLGKYLSAEELEGFRAELTASLEADPEANIVKAVQDLVSAKAEAELKAAAKEAAQKELEKQGLGGLGGGLEKLFGGKKDS